MRARRMVQKIGEAQGGRGKGQAQPQPRPQKRSTRPARRAATSGAGGAQHDKASPSAHSRCAYGEVVGSRASPARALADKRLAPVPARASGGGCRRWGRCHRGADREMSARSGCWPDEGSDAGTAETAALTPSPARPSGASASGTAAGGDEQGPIRIPADGVGTDLGKIRG